MKFTKEEIETAKKIYCNWNDKEYTLFCDYADSLLETKKIVVEIEYKLNKFGSEVILYEHNILECLTGEGYWSSVTKVTELPEGTWTDIDMIAVMEFYNNHSFFPSNALKEFKAERNKKEPYVEIIDERKRI